MTVVIFLGGIPSHKFFMGTFTGVVVISRISVFVDFLFFPFLSMFGVMA